ncbi:MAG: DUF1559 domain-containing protein [Planctomycetota bacterium]
MLQTRIDDGGRRGGLTRVEVVVLLGLLALLAAFVAPSLQVRHQPSRKLTCLSNIRIVGLAMQNFASSNNGNLPPLVDNLVVKSDKDAPQTGTLASGWPMLIMPAMDGSPVWKNIKRNAVVESGQAQDAVLRVGEAERIYFMGYACPDDADSHKQPGGLSYVVNAGFLSRSLSHGDPDGLHRVGHFSWDGNDVAGETADIEVAAATGVFWRKSEVFQSSLDYVGVGDGTTNTLMLSENLQAGNWWDTDTTRIAFGIPIETVGVRVPFGRGTFFESVERPLNMQFDGGTLSTVSPLGWRINSELKAATGTRPRPSSNHERGVNVIFCDGSGRFINDRIDPHVYVKLLTPNGVRYGEGELKQSEF